MLGHVGAPGRWLGGGGGCVEVGKYEVVPVLAAAVATPFDIRQILGRENEGFLNLWPFILMHFANVRHSPYGQRQKCLHPFEICCP